MQLFEDGGYRGGQRPYPQPGQAQGAEDYEGDNGGISGDTGHRVPPRGGADEQVWGEHDVHELDDAPGLPEVPYDEA